LCTYTNKVNGTSCDDSNAGTVNDVCRAGVCAGVDPCSGITCPLDQCRVNPRCLSGECFSSNAQNGIACNDNNTLTINDKCVSGKCVGDINPCIGVSCPDMPCKKQGACNATRGGVCEYKKVSKDSDACDDGDTATTADTCVAGVCIGFNLCRNVVCSDEVCRSQGSCDSLTGQCVYKKKNKGLVCDDGNAATLKDVCSEDGVCVADTSADSSSESGGALSSMILIIIIVAGVVLILGVIIAIVVVKARRVSAFRPQASRPALYNNPAYDEKQYVPNVNPLASLNYEAPVASHDYESISELSASKRAGLSHGPVKDTSLDDLPNTMPDSSSTYDTAQPWSPEHPVSPALDTTPAPYRQPIYDIAGSNPTVQDFEEPIEIDA
jgi:hypothetical protein